jgi:hypothetical protein
MSERLPTSDFLATGDRQEENRVTQLSGGGGAQMVKEEARAALFSEQEGQEFRSRWDRIQIAFVDEPRRAVEDADNLVATTMSRLAEVFSEERKRLEGQWDKGDASTEDLRLLLQMYRSFFNRLLSM